MTRVFFSSLFTNLVFPLLAWSNHCLAQTPCTGFNPDSQHWGQINPDAQDPRRRLCSRGMAVVFHSPVLGARKNPSRQALIANCCPMPEGSLTERHEYHAATCPENSVVTGARVATETPRTDHTYQEYKLRCTFINTEQFVLDAPQATLTFEFGNPDLTTITESAATKKHHTGRNMLPSWLRNGVARTGEYTWSGSGCIGYPWGSAMTTMSPGRCEGFVFRKISPR